MKRSIINNHIREAKEFMKTLGFLLPPFAYWRPEDWKDKGPEYDEIRENELGWDLTDFGRGDYDRLGLLLFTIRNGNVRKPSSKKPYAEKMLICGPGQVSPSHFHKNKMEDIIHRGGEGQLSIQLYCSRGEREQDEEKEVPVAVDGRNFTIPPGGMIRLSPGESITLFPGIFHKFWCDDTRLLLGEVSMVNDDHADNFFFEPMGRFPAVEEDEEPLHLLVGDYKGL
jgi:D-lyxose ketol-isomerase